MSDTEPVKPQTQTVDALEARYVVGALRRHGPVVIGLAVVFGVIGAGWSLWSPRVYRAETVLLVNIQQLRIGADGVPMDVELVLPARRLVGTVCESDKAMELLARGLSGESELTDDQLARRVKALREKLYYDQRGLEMAALRAVSNDPDEAARLANSWAKISQVLLREAYGTTDEDIRQVDEQIVVAKRRVLASQAALDQLGSDAGAERRLDVSNALDQAQRLLDELNQRHAELTERMLDTQSVATIVSEAAPPVLPINASARLVAGLFALAGGLLGLAVALIRVPGAKA